LVEERNLAWGRRAAKKRARGGDPIRGGQVEQSMPNENHRHMKRKEQHEGRGSLGTANLLRH